MKIIALSLLFIFVISCSSPADNKENNESTTHSSSHSNKSNRVIDESEKNQVSSECDIEDGTYAATVDYSNPETGYSQTYTLDVDVENCQVIQINFPKGGWLDDDHIDAAEIDEDGNASVSGENGRTYDIHIDN